MNKVGCKRLWFEERKEISRCIAVGMKTGRISLKLNRHRNTITKELNNGIYFNKVTNKLPGFAFD